MPDLSQLSDEELFKIANGGQSQNSNDLSSMSDEELFKIAGVQSAPSISSAPSNVSSDFMERMGQDYANRTQNITGTLDRSNRQTDVENLGQTLGQGLGLMSDTAGNIIGSGARYIPGIIKRPVTNAFNSYVTGAQELGTNIAETNIGSAVGRGLNALVNPIQEYFRTNPRAMANLEAGMNIASILPAGGVGKEAVTAAQYGAAPVGKVLEIAGQGISKVGEAQDVARKLDVAKKLVMPRVTPKVAESQVSRTTQSPILKRNIVKPTPFEQNAIDEVAKIPGISKSNSFQENYSIINKANVEEAQLLEKALQNISGQYDSAIFSSKLQNAFSGLKENNVFITAKKSEQRIADGVMTKVQGLIEGNPNTPAGLLKARKQFDQWAKSQKRKVFEGGQTAFSESVRTARNTIHDFIIELAPDAKVAASLKKQTGLFTALDNLAPKAAREGKNRLARIAEKMSALTPTSSPIANLVLAGGALGGLGFSGLALPAAGLGAAGVGIYQGAKALNNPIIKKGIGKTLSTTGKIITKGAQQ